MVVTPAVCILHYVIRLRFEALSCSRFQNISNGRCVVGACLAAARKSREGRELSLMSVYHCTLYCIVPVYNTEVKIQLEFWQPSCVGQNSVSPILSTGQRTVPAVLLWWMHIWSMSMSSQCLSAPVGDLEGENRMERAKLWRRPPLLLPGLEEDGSRSCFWSLHDLREITPWAHLPYQ